MGSYEVAGHVVDHPPLFACRKHKKILGLNQAFVKELLAWAPDMATQNFTDVAALCLDGDDLAFKLSDYLIPPKVLIFNPRKIEGPGALPFLVVLVDSRFYGIPASYLRRRIFDGCEECAKENDPASDAQFPDYRRPARKAPAAAAGAAAAKLPTGMTKSLGKPGAPGAAPPAQAPPKPATPTKRQLPPPREPPP
jgi:hypothetical protein